MDAGADHNSPADTGTDTSGVGGGSADAHPDVATDTGADTSSGDTAADMAVDTPADTAPDASGPCVTNYGAGNPVQFAFNGGINGGWYTFATHGSDATGLTTSLGASYTEGRMCAGALQLALNPTAYGQSGAIEYFYNTSPNWTGYKALHAYIKAETATPSEVNGVYFYVQSSNKAYYQSAFAAGTDLAGWTEVVIDLTRAPNSTNGSGVLLTAVQEVGFEVSLNPAAAPGAPATPSQLFLLADDIWLEAAPPSDAGSATDAGGQ